MKLPRWPRLGLRREILILLPITALLFVVLSSFTLLAYRSAIQLLVEEQQRQAANLAQAIASNLSSGSSPSIAELKRMAPLAQQIAVVTSDGRLELSFGQPDASQVLTPLGGLELNRAVGLGPDVSTHEFISGFARFDRNGETHYLRIDYMAYELARQRRMVGRLVWVVLPTNLALLLLLLLFLPYLLRPYDTLLQQAQKIRPRDPGDQDEVSFLISTVNSALEALTQATDEQNEDDILALQRTLGANLESGLLLLDNLGDVISLNPLGSKLIEVDSPETSTPLGQLLSSHPALREMLTQAVESKSGLHRQEIQIETSGGNRTLGLTVHELRRDDGRVRGHLVLFVDLTESQKEAEAQQLATSLAQLGELAAGVAHELRNSLATLRGYLQLIERKPDEESITDYLTEIRRESDHLQRVLEDFLSFARPESHRVEEVDLLSVVRRAAADPALQGQAVEIDTESSASHTIQGDSQLLERAVRNLLHNASRAQSDLSDSGPIDVGIQNLEDEIEILISDRGVGLPEEVRSRLFQPFVTGHPDGVGLGLSLTHRIVTLHGGQIAISERAGGGTEVRLSFPFGAFV